MLDYQGKLTGAQIDAMPAQVARAEKAASESKAYLSELKETINNLADGQSVSAQVAENTVKLSELTSETNKALSLLETQAKSLDSAVTNIVHTPVDDSALPTLCGQPPILFGAGTPQEAIVPDNWKQFDPETGEGYNWNGEPSAAGQQYINTSASTGGRYISVPSADGGLTWKNF